VKSKLPSTGTTIFATMSQLAAEYNAINLSQGFPNYSSDKKLFDLVYAYMQKGYNQYAPLHGVAELRAAIAQKIERLYRQTIDSNQEICITAGATQAVFTAIQTLVEQGDEVLIFDPSFDIYSPDVVLAGGIPKRIALSYPDFIIDWDTIQTLITEKTKLIILNTPNNPTGKSLTPADILGIENLLSQFPSLYLLSDEVYEHLVFDGILHPSILRYPNLYQRSIVTFSFGKTFHNTGWKVGYAVAPPKLMREFKKIHQFVVFSVNTPVQYALADYLNEVHHYLELPEIYQTKRDFFLSAISNSKFKFIPAEGTYFQLLDYSGISNENDIDFAIHLTKKIGVATIPISPFYEKKMEQKLLRLCFAKTNDVLEQAAEKLCRI
jgi:methionine aminotransferase